MLFLLSGHWKGNKKRSWWSHCQSKGETISWLFILLILIMVSTYFHLLQLPYHPMWFTISEFCVHFWFPGKSNARAIWFIYQCICKRLWCRGSDIFISTHYFIYLFILLLSNVKWILLLANQMIYQRFSILLLKLGRILLLPFQNNCYLILCTRIKKVMKYSQFQGI